VAKYFKKGELEKLCSLDFSFQGSEQPVSRSWGFNHEWTRIKFITMPKLNPAAFYHAGNLAGVARRLG